MTSRTWGIEEYRTAPIETRNQVHAWLEANVGPEWKELSVVCVTLHDAGTFTIKHVDYVPMKHANHRVPRVVDGDDGHRHIATKTRHGHMVTPFPIVFTE